MIDEKKLIKELSKNSVFEKITNAEGKNVFEIIEAQPQIQLEYETGKWMGSVCSCCGESVSEWYNFKFCPMCGAKMDDYEE